MLHFAATREASLRAQQPDAFTAAARKMWTSAGKTQVLVCVKELAARFKPTSCLILQQLRSTVTMPHY